MESGSGRSTSLKFAISYDTEPTYDYVFVETHTVGQDDWTTLPDTNGHTSDDPGNSCDIDWNTVHPFLNHYQTNPTADVDCTNTGTTGKWNAATGNSGGFQDWNAVSAQTLAQYGLTVGNVADGNLLQTIYSQANPATLAAHGITLPYSNFPVTTATVLQAIKAYPQYTNAIAPAAPLGKSWYDALQTTINRTGERH